MRRPAGFNWSSWRFMFDLKAADEEAVSKYRRTQPEFTESGTHTEREVEMIEIDPPVLVIPAQ